MKPICCGKSATPYRKDYGQGGWEEGFRCKKCGRIRIPSFNNDEKWAEIEKTMDLLREKAILEES